MNEAEGRSGRVAERWGRAASKAALVLAAAVVGFIVIPDRLVAFLTTRVQPVVRDSLVTAWVIAFFIFMSWAFVAIQRRGEG